jgi:adenylate cyclase
MFKWKYKYRKVLQDYLLGWFIAGCVWFLLRNTDLRQELFLELGGPEMLIVFIFGFFMQGFLYGVLFIALLHFLEKKIKFYRLAIVTTVLQLITGIIGISLIYKILGWVLQPPEPLTYSQFIQQPIVVISLIYTFVVNALIAIFIQINWMLGRGNLLRLLRGEFYEPRNRSKIFMFLDLKDSTTIAEALGHMKYSHFIKDFFDDLEVVHEYGTEVYQYIGDEAVLVWDHEAANVSNCVKAFYAFEDRLQERKEYYLSKHGYAPSFKAGVNAGEVIAVEIGDLRRDIAYHGDTVNTAARIQGQCNDLQVSFLTSEVLLPEIEALSAYETREKGEILLKGKQKRVAIHEIRRA